MVIRTAAFAAIVCGVLASSGCSPDSQTRLPWEQPDRLKAKVAELENENAELKAQLAAKPALPENFAGEQAERLKAEIAKLESENAQLNTQLATKPAMPVSLSFRKARLAQGYVAVFDTTVKSAVPVLVTHMSMDLGTTRQFELHLDPEIPTAVGGMDGVVFQLGDEVVVENRNYEPVRAIVEARTAN